MNAAVITGRVVAPPRFKTLRSSGQTKVEFEIESENPMKPGTSFRMLVLAFGGMADKINLTEGGSGACFREHWKSALHPQTNTSILFYSSEAFSD